MSIETHFGPGCGCSTVCTETRVKTLPTFDAPARIDGRVLHHPRAQEIANRARELRFTSRWLSYSQSLVLALEDLGLRVEADTLAAVGHLLENCPVRWLGYERLPFNG